MSTIQKRGAAVRYAVVGTGKRADFFISPIMTRFREASNLVALCDTNPARLEFYNRQMEDRYQASRLPVYTAEDFDRMIAETSPSVVIVSTVDVFHAYYIKRAMELGCDVITEKPMITDAQQCREVLDAVMHHGRKLRVSFNARWTPAATRVRQLLAERVIGKVIQVNMEYQLDVRHGADYFRRWHREKEKSGGLIVHKSTHHFDLVNWWLDSVPETVFGFGQLGFYGRKNAEERGINYRYDRYTGNETAGDPFALKLDADERLRSMYLDAEKYDGYRRDQNVFGEGITAEDSMSVLVKYRTGPVLNYSLNAYLPYEGVNVVFNGTGGRLEYREIHLPNMANLADARKREIRCTIYPMFGEPMEVLLPSIEGGHGGADPLIQEQIFSENPPCEMDARNAGHEQGAASALIGIAANQSFQSGKVVTIADLCPQLGTASALHQLI